MRINLNVPYEERHEAKALGARWDLARKTWYVSDVEDLTPFFAWMPTSHLLPKEWKKRKKVEKIVSARSPKHRRSKKST